jgi:hypothetical protein
MGDKTPGPTEVDEEENPNQRENQRERQPENQPAILSPEGGDSIQIHPK